jgi:hypothetical protein
LLQKVFEDISVPQIYAACDAAQKAPTFRSQYSFNQKWFSITYCETWFPLDPNTPTIPPHQTGKFHAEFQKKNGQKGIIVWNTIWEILSLISTFSKKEEPKKEIADTMDMWEYFDTVIFTELCENVSHSIQKKWAYMLNQNTYTVHERVKSTWDILTYYTPPQYIVEYPGRFSRETTGETLHINDKLIAESPTVPNLIQWLTHEHWADLKQKKVWEEKWPIFFSKEWFVELCEYIRDHVPDRKGKYDFNGTKYPLWIKLKWLFFGYVYYAEMPQKNNSTITVSARTPEKLYEKIFGPIITIENT